jgi:hypothetical protein
MSRELYSLVIPANAQTVSRSEIRRNLATHGLLDESSAAVESLSLEPGEQALIGQFRGKYASMMAAEVEELFDAGNISSVPFFDPAGSKSDGYYSLKNVDVEPLDPNLDHVQKFDGVLTKEGTRESKRRTITTTVPQVENDFGNQQTALVGVTAAATDVHWFNAETEETEPVSVVETRAGEHGDLDIVDALASSFDKPTLVYDLPYERAGKVDVVCWDGYGRGKFDVEADRLVGSATVSDSVSVASEQRITAWQWCFSTQHEFTGRPIVDNGLIRLWLGDRLRADTYDPAGGNWTLQSLGDSTWELDAWDINRISPCRVNVQCRFRDATQDPDATYTLDMSLKRGYWYPQWVVPVNESGPVPSGLVDLLSPIADESDYSPQCEQGLVAREEVRK